MFSFSNGSVPKKPNPSEVKKDPQKPKEATKPAEPKKIITLKKVEPYIKPQKVTEQKPSLYEAGNNVILVKIISSILFFNFNSLTLQVI